MEYLTKEAILQVEDLSAEDVEVPEWGGTVRVRGLTGTERDSFEAAIVGRDPRKAAFDMQNIRARLVAYSVVDGDGQRLFSEADIRALGEKSAVALQRVFEVAQRLSGLTAADVEELTKN